MKTRSLLIIGGIILVVGIIVAALIAQNDTYSWRETYDSEYKDPYGTYVILELLKNNDPQQETIILEDSVRSMLTEETNANYVFIGGGHYMNDEGLGELYDFVDRGNKAFVFTRSLPTDLLIYVLDTSCYDTGWYWESYYQHSDTLVALNFTHPSLLSDTSFQFQHVQKNGIVKWRRWNYLDPVFFCDEPFSPAKLGVFEDSLINFARIDVGEGAIFLHSMPSVFTNIHLIEENGLHYAERVFSHLNEGTIYWDEKSRVSERMADNMNYFSNRGLSEDNPLRYVLSQPPLAWAWFITLAMGLLYLIFRAKRRQRMIPVLEKNENTSLAFVSTIGRMYFLQNNHRQLALQKMQIFLTEIREKYKIATNELDDTFVKKLAIRSEVDAELIQKILTKYKSIHRAAAVNDNSLIEFHQLMEQFWRKA